MPAQAGMQGSEGMDTGFRGYDGIHPISSREGDTKITKFGEKEYPKPSCLRGEQYSLELAK